MMSQYTQRSLYSKYLRAPVSSWWTRIGTIGSAINCECECIRLAPLAAAPWFLKIRTYSSRGSFERSSIRSR